jgi:hypothetical protein
MRFKKLKIFVIIALVIFILVIGNTIFLSLSQKNQNSQALNLVTPTDIRKSSSTIQTINTPSQASVNQNVQPTQTSSATASSTSQTTPTTSSNSQTIISHPMMRTRAS